MKTSQKALANISFSKKIQQIKIGKASQLPKF
jgi:hypothetical protein